MLKSFYAHLAEINYNIPHMLVLDIDVFGTIHGSDVTEQKITPTLSILAMSVRSIYILMLFSNGIINMIHYMLLRCPSWICPAWHMDTGQCPWRSDPGCHRHCCYLSGTLLYALWLTVHFACYATCSCLGGKCNILGIFCHQESYT